MKLNNNKEVKTAKLYCVVSEPCNDNLTKKQMFNNVINESLYYV